MNTIIAALKMPRKIGDKISKAQVVLSKLTGNTNFLLANWPSNIVSLAQYETDVNNLTEAEIAVVGKRGTVAARDEALAIVMDDLNMLKAMVQIAATANKANAAVIIESAGYTASVKKGKPKRQNSALNTELEGTVSLTCDTAGHTEWEMSKDMATIINLPTTTTSTTTVNDLTPGDTWYFRNKKIDTKKTTHNWSPWIKLVIGPGGRIVSGGSNSSGHAGSLRAA